MRKASVDGNTDLMCQIDIIVFHSLFDPVEHKTDKAVFIKIGNKAPVFFRNTGAFCFFFYNISKSEVR